MAFINCDFYSNVLEMSTSMNIIIPEITKISGKKRTKEFKTNYPVLYLLHGLSDDHNAWMRKTSIERYAEEAGLAVIMPNADRSFYTNMEKGQNYFTFISQELPKISEKLFPIKTDRNNSFTAGLSMGGYGAFKLALNFPDRFYAAASLSGVLDIVAELEKQQNNEKLLEELRWVYGDFKNIKDSQSDLLYLLKTLNKKESKIPLLYQFCGTDDYLYQNNIKFRDFCLKNNIDLKYSQEKAAHEWSYWDQKIKSFIKSLPVNKIN